MEDILDGVFYSQLTNDEGHQYPWERKYLVLQNESLIFRESKEDTIKRGLIHLHDVVYCEVSEIPQPEYGDFILEIKTRTRATYLFGFESESQMNTWMAVFNRHKGVMRQQDLEPPPPPTKQYKKKERYTISKFIENRRIFGGMWMVYLFIIYTIVLVVLFSVLWTQYVLPLRGIDQESASCYIHEAEAEYRWKKIII